MKHIELSNGRIALVDDSDFEYLSKFKWSYAERNGSEYATRSYFQNGVCKTVKMHRVIMGVDDPNVFIDHIDCNGLNNCRLNLRTCTRHENARNRRSNKNSTSKYLGVSWKASKKRWYAGIKANGRHVYLGMSKVESEAAIMYNNGAKKYFGEFARLNAV